MPVSNPVVSSETLAAAVRAHFAKTYDATYRAPRAMLEKVMEFGVPAKARTETYAYYESADYPEYWPYGETIPQGSFHSVSYTVTCRRYGKRISWNEDDRKDDQTRSLMNRVRDLATHFGTLDERAFFDLLLGTTNVLPIGSSHTAPDGASYFATTAAGANRFGVSSGNLLTGTGTTVATIITDYYSAIAQFLLMKDTKGEPLHDTSLIDQGLCFLYGAAYTENVERAFLGQIVQGTQAGISNIVRDAARKVQLWGSSRITTNDFYVFLTADPLRSTAQIELEAMQTDDATRANSDFARNRGEEYFQAYARRGWVINLPYTAIAINNT